MPTLHSQRPSGAWPARPLRSTRTLGSIWQRAAPLKIRRIHGVGTVFFVFSGPCAEAFQPSVPRKFQQSLEELDPDFGDELDSAGVSAYLNVLPAEAGRDRNVMRTAKPKRVPVRPQGKLEWVTLRATARKFVKETNLELAKTQYETILQTKISGLPARTVASLHIELGNVYVKLGDEGAARYHFQEAQAFVPQHALPHIRMAARHAARAIR